MFGIEHTQSTADLQAHAVDSLDHFENVVERVLLVTELTPSSPHTESGGSRILGLSGSFEYLLDLHGRFGLDKGLVTGGLGAVRAIFGTSSSLNTKKGALLNFSGVPVHAVNSGSLVHELVEGLIVYLSDLFFSPIMADGGVYIGHGAGLFILVEFVALAVVVRESIGL